MAFNNSNNIHKADGIIDSINNPNIKVKRVKRDNGLIERKEVSGEKIILVEDNRQVLFG